MINIQHLSYSFPNKELYNNISFNLERGHHCAFIGTSGSGKSTLIEMIKDSESYLFEGKIAIDPNCRIGFVSQFSQLDKTEKTTVYDYIAAPFLALQSKILELCTEMETSSNIDSLMDEYQLALDAFDAIDGNDFESNIQIKLNMAHLMNLKNHRVSDLSGGEFKLIQVIKEMLLCPDVMIMDEPDVFLDFNNLNGTKTVN
jgi:ATP-binding cassette, subfamily F, member 3